ncbi:nucleoside triphosphate pyrophosphohydrolase family protein [Candidatus Saccharibacteria bacterium]|nr:nucleoside triphosphate pyrophosphohydrolase family protein [Candidatus Saccharibacteria bacterium]
MQFDEYQKLAARTDAFSKPDSLLDPAFLEKVLGLVGESGEFADKIKKLIRDQNGEITDKDELVKELGDVLWYLAMIANYLDVDLSAVAKENIAKLADRQKRNIIKGAGDNR